MHITCRLDDADGRALYAATRSSLEIRYSEDLRAWLAREAHTLLPHEAVHVSVGKPRGEAWKLEYAVSNNLPGGYLDALQATPGVLRSPVLARWMATGQPQLFGPGHPNPYAATPWFEVFSSHQLNSLLMFGMRDLRGSHAASVALYGLRRLGAREALLVQLLMPHIQRALSGLYVEHRRRTAVASGASGTTALSPRETEILALMARGISNGEISQRLRRSTSTVKNQVHSVLHKLSVKTRSEAVFKAVRLRLLAPEHHEWAHSAFGVDSRFRE